MKFKLLAAFAAFTVLFLISDKTVGQQGMGVGNNNPLEMLDVSGAIKIGTDITNSNAAPTGGAGTIRFRTGQYEGWDGAAWIPLGGGSGSDPDWTISGTDQYSAVTGNVGIGTNTPQAKLNLYSTTNNEAGGIRLSVSNGSEAGIYSNNHDLILRKLNKPDQLVLDMTGRIGVGTSSPQAMLDINADIPNSNGGIRLSRASGNGLIYMESNDMILRKANQNDQLVLDNTGRIGVGINNPQAKLHINHIYEGASGGIQITQNGESSFIYTSTAQDLHIERGANTNHLVLDVGGYVGVGTDAPTSKLQVQGAIHMVDGNESAGYIPVSDANGTMTWTDPTTISSATGNELVDSDNDTKIQVEESADEDIIRFDIAGTEAYAMTRTAITNVPVLSFGGTPSFYVGNDISGNATDNFNVAIGYNSATALTTANGVTLIGSGAGRYMTNGTNNTCVGLRAGLSATTADNLVILGAYAGEDLVTGDSNVFIGTASAQNKTGGNGNVAVGAFAGYNNGTGQKSVFLGYQAGFNESGGNKLYIENSNSTNPLIYGEFNNDWVKINGNLSATEGFTDNDNDTKIQVEESADEDIIRFDLSGTERFSMNGPRLGVMNSGRSVFIGESAGAADDLSNNDNSFVGYESGNANTTGNGNTALGTRSMLNNNGDNNTAVGLWALYSNSTGIRNAVLGSQAGQSITGNRNTIIGALAGKDATGSHNIFLGYTAGFSETGDHKLYIENSSSTDPLIYGEFDNDLVGINGNLGVGTEAPEALLHVNSATFGDATGIKLTQSTSNSLIYHSAAGDLILRKMSETDQLVLDAAGNVGVGTNAPTAKLHVVENSFNGINNFAASIENTSNWSGYSNGLRITAGQNSQTDNNRFISFRRPDGTEVGAVRQITSASVDFWSPSDQRLKTNIQNTTRGLADLMQLQVRDYVYKDDPEKPQTGFMAQEVYEVFPNAVSVGGDDAKTDPWMMNYGNLTPLLVKAVQDLSRQNDDLQKQVEELKKQIQGPNRN